MADLFELSLSLWLLTAAAGFAAGMLDSIVGGGGLILTPAMLNLHPQLHILQAIATQRTSSIAGTSVAAWNYLRRIAMPRPLLISACASALIASAFGVQLAKSVPPLVLKWAVLTVCVVLAVYTLLRKDMGLEEARRYSGSNELIAVICIAAGCGFYNGLIGPGTGTLLVFAFVSVIGFDFLRASAISKATNAAADLSSWTVLFFAGFVQWKLAIPLIVGNVAGSYLGSKMALKQGQTFVRALFLIVVSALILKLLWDLFQS